MSKTKNRPGPKTKASRGERRYVKRTISLSPTAGDYVLSQIDKGEVYSNTVDRIILEHQVLTSQPPPSAKYGLWDNVNSKWLEYYWTDEEAATSHEQIGQAGITGLSVCGINGNDDKWLNEMEV